MSCSFARAGGRRRLAVQGPAVAAQGAAAGWPCRGPPRPRRGLPGHASLATQGPLPPGRAGASPGRAEASASWVLAGQGPAPGRAGAAASSRRALAVQGVGAPPPMPAPPVGGG